MAAVPKVEIPPEIPADVKRVIEELEEEAAEAEEDMDQGLLEDIWLKAGEMDLHEMTPDWELEKRHREAVREARKRPLPADPDFDEEEELRPSRKRKRSHHKRGKEHRHQCKRHREREEQLRLLSLNRTLAETVSSFAPAAELSDADAAAKFGLSPEAAARLKAACQKGDFRSLIKYRPPKPPTPAALTVVATTGTTPGATPSAISSANAAAIASAKSGILAKQERDKELLQRLTDRVYNKPPPSLIYHRAVQSNPSKNYLGEFMKFMSKTKSVSLTSIPAPLAKPTGAATNPVVASVPGNSGPAGRSDTTSGSGNVENTTITPVPLAPRGLTTKLAPYIKRELAATPEHHDAGYYAAIVANSRNDIRVKREYEMPILSPQNAKQRTPVKEILLAPYSALEMRAAAACKPRLTALAVEIPPASRDESAQTPPPRLTSFDDRTKVEPSELHEYHRQVALAQLKVLYEKPRPRTKGKPLDTISAVIRAVSTLPGDREEGEIVDARRRRMEANSRVLMATPAAEKGVPMKARQVVGKGSTRKGKPRIRKKPEARVAPIVLPGVNGHLNPTDFASRLSEPTPKPNGVSKTEPLQSPKAETLERPTPTPKGQVLSAAAASQMVLTVVPAHAVPRSVDVVTIPSNVVVVKATGGRKSALANARIGRLLSGVVAEVAAERPNGERTGTENGTSSPPNGRLSETAKDLPSPVKSEDISPATKVDDLRSPVKSEPAETQESIPTMDAESSKPAAITDDSKTVDSKSVAKAEPVIKSEKPAVITEDAKPLAETKPVVQTEDSKLVSAEPATKAKPPRVRKPRKPRPKVLRVRKPRKPTSKAEASKPGSKPGSKPASRRSSVVELQDVFAAVVSEFAADAESLTLYGANDTFDQISTSEIARSLHVDPIAVVLGNEPKPPPPISPKSVSVSGKIATPPKAATKRSPPRKRTPKAKKVAVNSKALELPAIANGCSITALPAKTERNGTDGNALPKELGAALAKLDADLAVVKTTACGANLAQNLAPSVVIKPVAKCISSGNVSNGSDITSGNANGETSDVVCSAKSANGANDSAQTSESSAKGANSSLVAAATHNVAKMAAMFPLLTVTAAKPANVLASNARRQMAPQFPGRLPALLQGVHPGIDVEKNYNGFWSKSDPYCCVCSFTNKHKILDKQSLSVAWAASISAVKPDTSNVLVSADCFPSTGPNQDEAGSSAALAGVLLTCVRCNATVHAACYGVTMLPAVRAVWKCDKCRCAKFTAACCLCHLRGGALKRTSSGGWVHLVCALVVPGVTFKNRVCKEPVNTATFSTACKNLECLYCHRTSGACVRCHEPSCSARFHVTCCLAACGELVPAPLPATVTARAFTLRCHAHSGATDLKHGE